MGTVWSLMVQCVQDNNTCIVMFSGSFQDVFVILPSSTHITKLGFDTTIIIMEITRTVPNQGKSITRHQFLIESSE